MQKVVTTPPDIVSSPANIKVLAFCCIISRPKMASPSSGKRRKDADVVKLMASEHEVTILGGLDEFMVKFRGPQGTLYQGGIWQVLVQLPDQTVKLLDSTVERCTCERCVNYDDAARAASAMMGMHAPCHHCL